MIRIINTMSEKVSINYVNGYHQTNTGTFYDINTPISVIGILESARINHHRIRLFYGDTITGQDWNEENDTIGYIGRSTGTTSNPILLNNNRSIGGGSILDHCIVKIMQGQKVLYKHPKYNCLQFITSGRNVLRDGIVVARFKTARQANKYVAFMRGDRHTRGGK